MPYFRELPNIQYQNFLETDSTGSQDFITIKNLFLRGKLRDDLQNILTVFNKYEISENERPDQIAQKLYGDPTLDWVVRVTANIINYQNDLPLNSQELWEYINNKYDSNANDIREYRSVEIRDSRNNLIYPSNIVVDEDFSVTYFDTVLNTYVTKSGLDARDGVTNFEYETEINDEKKTIYVLRPEYLGQFLSDMRDLATYGFNSEFINSNTIRTENTRITSP